MPQMTRQSQVIYYNGYSNFGPYTKVERMECRPEKDLTGRTTVGNRYSLTLRTVVTGQNAKNESLLMRRALSKNGGRLIITGLASGDIRVNDGAVRDTQFGPWVETLSFDPTYGGELATVLVWTVSWIVPECDDAAYRFRVSEFSYTVAYSQDEAGYGTRVIDMRLRIPQNYQSGNSGPLQDNPELYALSVLPPEIPGFRRLFGTRTISEDRSELRWQITDVQLAGTPPYPGVVKEEGSFNVSSDSTMGVCWNGSINYECELPPDGSLNTAIDAMSSFVSYRTNLLRNLRNRNRAPATIVPVSFSITEPECFGRKRFQFGFTFTITTTLQELLLKSGIWTSPPNRNWQKWSASLQDTALNPRGYYELTMDVGQDRVTSLCSATPPKIFTQGFRVRRQLIENGGLLQFPPVAANNSWRVYKNRIWLEQESGVVATRTLPMMPLGESVERGGTLVANGQFNFGGTSGSPFGGGVGAGLLAPFEPPPPGGRLENNPISPEGNTSATQTARPQQWVMMEGEAVRIGFPVPQPALETVNGVPVVLANRVDLQEGFKQWADYSNGIQPFYKATWRLRYAVNGDLPDLPLPPAPNPLLN